jgi:hypothetical protein
MGMLDRMFAPEADKRATLSDFALAMLPIAGPFLARDKRDRRANKHYQRWLSENAAYTDPNELGEMGQRVQQRMLTRTGGELSTPGLMAATSLKRNAENEKTGNFGNVLMNTTTDLAAAGDTNSAMRLGAIAHKDYQTPWKPSEGGADIENYKFPDGSFKATADPRLKAEWIQNGAIKAGTAPVENEVPWEIKGGHQLGMQNKGALGNYAVQYNSDGSIRDIKTMGGQQIDISSNMVTPSDLSGAVMGFTSSIAATQQSTRAIDQMLDNLDRNPTGGVTGWSGLMSNVVGKVMNVAQFLSPQDKSVLGKYENALVSFGRKYFPTGDEALMRSSIIELGYALARINNMGTAGGGRGITDADMQFALQQLGSMGAVEDFRGVLEMQRSKMIDQLKLKKAETETIIKFGGKDPAELETIQQYHEALQPRRKAVTADDFIRDN